MGRARVTLVAALALLSVSVAAAPSLAAPSVAVSSVAAPLVLAQPVESPSPTDATPGPTVPAAPPAEAPEVNQRTGGSEPAPGRGKPGWVWWALATVGIILVVGVLRLWRSAAD
jgi:hypothetical protein